MGIELSHAGNHINQKTIKEDWINENHKRNLYLETAKIPIITFTDDQLRDIQTCFEQIKYIFEPEKSKRFL